MAVNSKIEWCSTTWNPVTGCAKVSAGCDHCYAERITERFHGKGSFETVVLHEDRLKLPLKWRQPRMIFVNSMSDLFHDDVPAEFIAKVFDVMGECPRHIFQILTKRPGRMASLLTKWNRYDPLPNVWLGASIEDQRWTDIRVPKLLRTPAALKFLSVEPLLGPVSLTRCLGWRRARGVLSANPEIAQWSGLRHAGLGWVIVGGESGPGARPMDLDLARDVVTQCRHAQIPVFVKQLGSAWARKHGGDPKGGDMTLWPEDLRVREMPQAVTHV